MAGLQVTSGDFSPHFLGACTQGTAALHHQGWEESSRRKQSGRCLRWSSKASKIHVFHRKIINSMEEKSIAVRLLLFFFHRKNIKPMELMAFWAVHCFMEPRFSHASMSIPWNNSFIFLQGMGDISRLTLISPLCYITTIVNGKTMENHHFEWENALFQWPCSIAMLNYTHIWHFG